MDVAPLTLALETLAVIVLGRAAWRTRTALSGVLAAVAAGAILVGLWADLAATPATLALVGAGLALGVGTVLLLLGQLSERLLTPEPGDDPHDRSH